MPRCRRQPPTRERAGTWCGTAHPRPGPEPAGPAQSQKGGGAGVGENEKCKGSPLRALLIFRGIGGIPLMPPPRQGPHNLALGRPGEARQAGLVTPDQPDGTVRLHTG
eukprot:gene18796-biopygen18994